MKKIFQIVAVFIFLSGSAVFVSEAAPRENTQTTVLPRVEIFVTSWCPYCRRLESFLKQSRIDYTRYDVEADAKGAQIFEELGGTGVPVARVGKKVIYGSDPERIIAALKR